MAYSALQGIGNLIIIYTKQMAPFMGELAPKVLFSMSSDKDTVTNHANFVLQLMETNYGADKLIPNFIKCLDQNYLARVKAGALEVLTMLIKNSSSCFLVDGNVRQCVQKVVQMACDYHKNSKILMPALGVILALRDKNYESTISTLLTLPESQLTKVRVLARENAPDLEDNMASFAGRESLGGSKVTTGSPGKMPSPGRVSDPGSGLFVKHDPRINVLKGISKPKQQQHPAVGEEEETKAQSKSPQGGDTNRLGEMLASEEIQYTSEEIADRLQLIADAIQSGFRGEEDVPPTQALLRFIFNNAIYGAEEWLQETGFITLSRLVAGLPRPALESHLEDLVANLVKCYIFPRKVWEHVDELFKDLVDAFTAEKVVALLTQSVTAERPPLLQAVLRALTITIRNTSPTALMRVMPEIKEPLLVV